MVKIIPEPISFEWDESNLNKNWDKHKVIHSESEEIFFNKPRKIFKDIKHSQKEERFIAFGTTNKSRKLYIVFTIRKDRIRIISARDQSKRERRFYENK